MTVLAQTFAAHLLVGLRAARTYAVDCFVGLLTYPIELAMTFLMWRLFLAEVLSADQALAYYAVVLLVLRIGPSRFVSLRMEQEVASGNLVVHLVRPCVPWAAIAGRELAVTVINFVCLFPVTVLVVWAIRRSFPPVLDFALWLLLAIALRTFVRLIVGAVSFWTVRNVGLVHAVEALMGIASGSVLPLSFFPGWVRAALDATPFPHLVYVPAWAMMGQLAPGEAAAYALTGLAWTGALMALFQLLWLRGLRRFTGAGV